MNTKNITLELDLLSRDLIIYCKAGKLSEIELARTRGTDIYEIDDKGCTLLHYSVERRCTHITDYISRNKSILNVQNAIGYSPLHVAAAVRDEKGAAMLLKRGANLNVCDFYGRTPLHASFLVCPPPITLVKLFFRWNALPDTIDYEGRSCYNAAKDTGDERIIACFDAALVKKQPLKIKLSKSPDLSR